MYCINKFTLSTKLHLLPLLLCWSLWAGAPLKAETLRSAADNYGISVGSIVGTGVLGTDSRHDNTLATHYHIGGPENALKFPDTEPSAYGYQWTSADPILNFATSHGMRCRGHTLVWHGAIPNWLTNITYTTSQLQTILYDHIDTVVGRYSSTLPWWDVVNEAISDSGGAVRSTLWYNQPGIGFAGQGTRYIEEAFRRARAADAAVELFYNEYSIETVNTKSTAVFNMATNFLARGIPINGVGFQFHIGLGGISYSSMRQNFQRFNDAGLNLHITEMDVKLPVDTNGVPAAADLSAQADIYFGVLGVASAFPRFKIFQTWGFTDAHSWIPGFYPGFGSALPFDKNYNKKPAYWAIYNALANQAEKLAISAVSSGTGTMVTNDLKLSAGGGLWVDAHGANDLVTLTTSVPYPGTWNVRVGVRKGSNCAAFQLATSPAGSNNFINLGAAQDTYSASQTYTDLDLGNLDFSAGDQWLRFTVTGKNGSSAGFGLLLDYIRLTPIDCAPTISRLADRVIAQNTSTGPIPVSVDDDFTHAGSLLVTASSSDSTLVPPGNLALGGSGVNRTLNVIPAANQLGNTMITVGVSDGTRTNSTSFSLNVVVPGARPAISAVAGRTIAEGSATGPIPFVVSDTDTPAAALVVTAISSNPALVSLTNIVLSGNDSNRFVTVSPTPNQNGTATITLTVSDGLLSSSTSFLLTVTPVDFPPVIQLKLPADGARFTAPEPVLVTAAVAAPDTNVVRVEFYANGALLNIDSNASPYSVLWMAPPGAYTIQAIARDATGFSATSAVAAITVAVSNVTSPSSVFVLAGSLWRYLDTGVAPAGNWNTLAFNDSSWSNGYASLGYGGKGEVTTVSYGPNINSKYITTWFRRAFTVPRAESVRSLNVSFQRDDGLVLYLNGAEILRSNMPTNAITPATLATHTVSGAEETNWFFASLPVAGLLSGTNILAAEIHQVLATSSDIGFNLQLLDDIDPSKPWLTVAQNNGSVTLRWPDWTTAFALESSLDLGPSASWAQVTNTPLAANGQFTLTYNTNAASRVFRLSGH